MSATKLLETIKQAANEVNAANQPLNLCYGRVTSTSPLNVLVDNKMQLSSEFLIVPEYLTEHERDVTVEWNTESHEHSHGIEDTYTGGGSASTETHKHSIKGRKTTTVHAELKSGDKVMLLRMQGGQSYLILCRL